MVSQWVNKRGMDEQKEQMKVVAMFIGRVQNGHLLCIWLKSPLLQKNLAFACKTMLHPWHHMCLARGTGLIISPETNSQKNKRG